jgi:hypothetical protein
MPATARDVDVRLFLQPSTDKKHQPHTEQPIPSSHRLPRLGSLGFHQRVRRSSGGDRVEFPFVAYPTSSGYRMRIRLPGLAVACAAVQPQPYCANAAVTLHYLHPRRTTKGGGGAIVLSYNVRRYTYKRALRTMRRSGSARILRPRSSGKPVEKRASRNVSNLMKGDHHETDCSTTTGSQDLDPDSTDTELTWMCSCTNHHTNHLTI